MHATRLIAAINRAADPNCSSFDGRASGTEPKLAMIRRKDARRSALAGRYLGLQGEYLIKSCITHAGSGDELRPVI